MKKLLAIGIVAALVLAFTGEQEARAQGVHLNLGRLHVDVGRPHGGHGHRSYYGGGGYSRGARHGGGYSHGARHGGGLGGYHGRSAWHDTSHYDFHPGGYERHYDHYDYVPAHYDFHRQGHFDRH